MSSDVISPSSVCNRVSILHSSHFCGLLTSILLCESQIHHTATRRMPLQHESIPSSLALDRQTIRLYQHVDGTERAPRHCLRQQLRWHSEQTHRSPTFSIPVPVPISLSPECQPATLVRPELAWRITILSVFNPGPVPYSHVFQ